MPHPDYMVCGATPRGWGQSEAARVFPYPSPDLALARLVSLRLDHNFPHRHGYGARTPPVEHVRATYAADDVASAYAAEWDDGAGGRLHAGIEAPVGLDGVSADQSVGKYAVLRAVGLVERERAWDFGLAYVRLWADGVRAPAEPEEAGGEAILRAGHWMAPTIEHGLVPSTFVHPHTNPGLLDDTQRVSLLSFLDQVAVLGHLALSALEIFDPASAGRHKRAMEGFRLWYRDTYAVPIPSHWDFGLCPAVQVAAGVGHAVRCGSGTDAGGAHAAEIYLPIGNGFRELAVYVPQLRAVIPVEPGDCVLIQTRKYRHANVGGSDDGGAGCVRVCLVMPEGFTEWAMGEYERRLLVVPAVQLEMELEMELEMADGVDGGHGHVNGNGNGHGLANGYADNGADEMEMEMEMTMSMAMSMGTPTPLPLGATTPRSAGTTTPRKRERSWSPEMAVRRIKPT